MLTVAEIEAMQKNSMNLNRIANYLEIISTSLNQEKKADKEKAISFFSEICEVLTDKEFDRLKSQINFLDNYIRNV